MTILAMAREPFKYRPTALGIFILLGIVGSLVLPAEPALALSSRDDLVSQMLASLRDEMPSDISAIAFWKLDNTCGAPVDIDLLREDLEIAIIQAGRFRFINRDVLEEALREMEFCTDVGCLVDPQTMQRFGNAKGVDAFIYGEIIDASTRYPDLGEKDYFLTVLLKVISAQTSSIVWAKEITGVNTENVLDVIGQLPVEDALWREEGFGREIAGFLEGSTELRSEGVLTVALWRLEDASGQDLDMDLLYRGVSTQIIDRTRFALVDRRNLELLLEEQRLIIEGIVDQAERSKLGKLFGIDAFIYGRIRSATDESITAAMKVNKVESMEDIDADVLTGSSRDLAYKLVNLLRSAGPSSFDSSPRGASVRVNSVGIGATPCEYQLTHGEYEVIFSMAGYRDTTLTVLAEYGQPQRVFVDFAKLPTNLTIVSRPPGASVWIDGEAISGETPLHGVESTQGEHDFLLKKQDYFDTEETRGIYEPEAELTFELRSVFGTLEVTTGEVEGADVNLNGSETGEVTPTWLERLTPRIYNVEVKKYGYHKASRSIDVPASEITKLDLEMKPKTRGSAIWRSILVPGLGQFYKGQRAKGTGFLVGAGAAAAFTIANHTAREDAIDQYDAAKKRYDAAVAQEDIDAAYAEMEEKYKEIDDKEKMRNYGYVALAGIRVANIIDAAVGFPMDKSGVRVSATYTPSGAPGVMVSFGGGR